MKIKITATTNQLERMWNQDYAENAGKVLEVEKFDKDGWAITDRWRFMPEHFEIIEQ